MKLEPVDTAIGRIEDPVERLVAFIREREAIRVRKEDMAPGAWPIFTGDPILATYRFCNVRREDDRVTRWIAEHWRTPHADDPDLWFAMVVARFINWPETLQWLGYPTPWVPLYFTNQMEFRAKKGGKLWTGAYMIRAGDVKGEPKYAYQEREVFTPLWEARQRLRPEPGDTLNSYHMRLMVHHGMGSFMVAQVVADLKYVEPLKSASDWWTFAASGPGSRRGLNRVLGRDKDSPWTEENWRFENERLRQVVNKTWGGELFHGQDVQNICCESDKYERVRLGEGRPRALYKSHA